MGKVAEATTVSRAPNDVADPTAANIIERPRLETRLDGDWLVAVLVAPPGYGKSILLAQWATRAAVRVVRVVLDGRDDDVDRAAVADAAGSVLAAADESVLFVECTQPTASTPAWDVLAELVDAFAPRLRVAVMSHVDPPLPLAHWHASGVIRVLRGADLRFADEEALAVAAAVAPSLRAENALRLNEVVEGWPLAFSLGLVAGPSWTPDSARLPPLLHSLVVSVVEQLTEPQRRVARSLAVLDWFDEAAAAAVTGTDVKPLIAELRHRHLLERTTARGGFRFHGLIRETLRGELQWHDPDRYHELLHRAADYWLRRGEIESAHRQLTSVRERTAEALVVAPALAYLDTCDQAGLGRVRSTLPRPGTVEQAAVSLDLAIVSLIAGERHRVRSWLDRAEAIGLGDEVLVARSHLTRSFVAMVDGDLSEWELQANEFLRTRPRSVRPGPWEERFGLIAARLALLHADVVEAQTWIDVASSVSTSPAIRDVSIPGLQVWHDSLVGLNRRAVVTSYKAVARADELGLGSLNYGACDTFIAAAWAALRAGDLAQADGLAGRAAKVSEQLNFDWQLVRAAEVGAQVYLARRRWGDALAVIHRVRRKLLMPDSRLSLLLTGPEAAALWRLGRTREAVELASIDLEGSATRLARASMALDAQDDRLVLDLLVDSDAWLLPDRVRASVLAAVAAGDERRLIEAVEHAAATGLVWSFLGQGLRTEEALLRLPLEELHPALVGHLRAADRGHSAGRRSTDLTARERSLLQLLPSHLTYAQIADRLDLSVNTVKGNLKSIYRKLDVTARSAAVEVARAGGLIRPSGRDG